MRGEAAEIDVAPGAGESLAPKRYTHGTHRTCAPEETLARLQPLLATMGITRVANVTGLDRTGVPVVMVVRPNARSVAVSQGKGLTLAAAKASGVMEAAELWHAERIANPLKLMSHAEMRLEHRVADPDLLPRAAGGGFHPHLPILWIEGRDLVGGEPVWVPFELVGANYTLPLPPGSGCFQASTNGLASGNHPLEAICHGLCEVVERDASTLWKQTAEAERREIDPATVTDADCLELIGRLRAAGLRVRIWDTTSDVGVASFCCLLAERDGAFADPEYGNGCHPAREVALMRALTEAAQARTTFISGARDDFPIDAWEAAYRERRREALAGDLDAAPAGRASYAEVPTFAAATLAGDLDWLLTRLGAVGIGQVIAVDLGKEGLGISVVRVVVPGLEGPDDQGGDYLPGPRARRRVAWP